MAERSGDGGRRGEKKEGRRERVKEEGERG